MYCFAAVNHLLKLQNFFATSMDRSLSAHGISQLRILEMGSHFLQGFFLT